MKIGCCTSIDQVYDLYKAGFDFIECPVVSLIPEESDDKFQKILQQYENSPLPVEVCNILLPNDLKIVGERIDKKRVENYMKVALSRVKQIGADTVVFGSGAARSIPDNFSKEKGKEQIIEFLKIAVNYAASLNIMIVIEPLNQKESNMINSIQEAVEFVKEINQPFIQVLADFYHMVEENESLENIVLYQKYLKHIHVADTNRMPPGMESYPYKQFVKYLKRAKYEDRISIECKWNDFNNEILKAQKFLSKIFNN